MPMITKETMDLIEAVKGVYGKFPKTPEGCEVIGFGAVESGSTWLDYFDKVRTDSPDHTSPRIILRKSPPPPPPVLSATITTDEVYPGGYEVPEGYKVLGFGRRNDFPGATHFIGVVQGAPSRRAEPIDWMSNIPRRILLEKI